MVDAAVRVDQKVTLVISFGVEGCFGGLDRGDADFGRCASCGGRCSGLEGGNERCHQGLDDDGCDGDGDYRGGRFSQGGADGLVHC